MHWIRCRITTGIELHKFLGQSAQAKGSSTNCFPVPALPTKENFEATGSDNRSKACVVLPRMHVLADPTIIF